jgi:hypothetical protein
VKQEEQIEKNRNGSHVVRVPIIATVAVWCEAGRLQQDMGSVDDITTTGNTT